METSQRIIITGALGTGKTTLCQIISEKVSSAGLEIKGLISPAVFENHQKVGIDAVDLSSNQRYRLANLLGHSTHGPQNTTLGKRHYCC